jgi:putative endopeptidase
MRSFRTLLVTTALVLPLAAPAFAVVTASERAPVHQPRTYLQDTLSAEDSARMAELGKSYGVWGFDTAGMDTSVKPGDDFNLYANGKALAAMKIPGDQPGYGSFNRLADLSELQLKAMVTGLAARDDLTGSDLKVADLYRSATNEALKNKLGAAPLAPELSRIRSITNKSQMAKFMGWTSEGFGSAFFSLYVYDDAKKPGYYALQLAQGGLGLPDRDYYLSDTYADKKAGYEAYVTDMLRLVGWPDAAKAAKDIVAMETKIAEAHWTRIESRDDTKTYNPMKLSELPAYAPGFDWNAFFAGARVTTAQKVVIAQNTAFPKIAKIYADAPLETLKAWSAFRTVDQAAPYLSDAFVDRRFQFRLKSLYGIEEQRPLWKRALSVTDERMGEALGKAYVATYFPPESKAKMEGLVQDLLAAMKIRIEKLDWMSAPTKAKALEKLSTFGVKIGYQNKWRDYSSLVIKPDDLVGNLNRSSVFEWDYQRARIDNKIDEDVWEMTPQTVNAYYSPTKNEIVFPAAILQPPFFDPKADPAVNYGGIGAVIGHEIVHGFDDQGRNYDATGALADWWQKDDADKFNVQAKKLGEQFDAYEVAPGVKVQGGLTMGENIGDLGGLTIALDAYHLSLDGKEAPVMDGLTGDQRVFLGFAQVWQSKYQPDFLKFLVASDPHAPDQFRAMSAPRNMDAWYKAFNVTDGKYYLKPEDRVRIW